MAQKLNLLAASGSRNELARILQLPPDQMARILSVEGKNRAGGSLEDITEDYLGRYITVKANDKYAPLFRLSSVHWFPTSAALPTRSSLASYRQRSST